MSNLDVLNEIQKIYDPKTAFGNPTLLKLFSCFVKPNDKGFFEIEADREVIVRIGYRCPDCGAYCEDDVREDDQQIRTTCRCKAKLLISF